MAIAGDASRWTDLFPDGLVPQILDVAVAAWDAFEKPDPGEIETRITKQFRRALSHEIMSRDLPFRVDREVPVDDDVTAEEKGRIDLRFTTTVLHDRAYFAFECKRLCVKDEAGKTKTLATEYVTEGLMRFVNGKYSVGQRHGGMIGYVMSGCLDRATRGVANVVLKRSKELRLRSEGGLAPSSLRPGDERACETQHDLDDDLQLQIEHLFLTVERV